MTTLFIATTDAQLERYQATLTGEKLGWLVYLSEHSFAPVHRVLVDPLEGPIIITGHAVLALGDGAAVYTTEAQAREAYWGLVQAATVRVGVIRPETGS